MNSIKQGRPENVATCMLDLSSEAEHTVPFHNHAKTRKPHPHHSPDTAMLRKARNQEWDRNTTCINTENLSKPHTNEIYDGGLCMSVTDIIGMYIIPYTSNARLARMISLKSKMTSPSTTSTTWYVHHSIYKQHKISKKWSLGRAKWRYHLQHPLLPFNSVEQPIPN